jgi:hypothetical protein
MPHPVANFYLHPIYHVCCQHPFGSAGRTQQCAPPPCPCPNCPSHPWHEKYKSSYKLVHFRCSGCRKSGIRMRSRLPLSPARAAGLKENGHSRGPRELAQPHCLTTPVTGLSARIRRLSHSAPLGARRRFLDPLPAAATVPRERAKSGPKLPPPLNRRMEAVVAASEARRLMFLVPTAAAVTRLLTGLRHRFWVGEVPPKICAAEAAAIMLGRRDKLPRRG